MKISAVNFKSDINPKTVDPEKAAKRDIRNKTSMAYSFPGLVQLSQGDKKSGIAHLAVTVLSIASSVFGTQLMFMGMLGNTAAQLDKGLAKTISSRAKLGMGLAIGGPVAYIANSIISGRNMNNKLKKAYRAEKN